MGNWRSSEALSEELIVQIQNKTGFTAIQIEKLWNRFNVLDKDSKGYLTREDFLNISELSLNPVSKLRDFLK